MTSQMSILNPYPQKLPGPSLLHELVRQDVSDNTPALDYQDERGDRHTVTYEILHHKSDILASHLKLLRDEKRLPQTERFIVPVFIGQCPELYITQLAILKAGGAFCPITLDVPEERLRFILQDTSAPVLVTTTEVKSRLPQLDNVSIFIADEILKGKAATSRSVSIEPCMPAYVMYTSGSTGQPKGVLLSHSAATQALLAHDRHIPTFSRFLQFASPTFDVSVFEIFFPLFRGCTLVVCERKRMLNDLPASINALDVDAAELTPSVANSLLQGRESVPKLKVLLTIGEMLKQSVVEDFGGSADREAVLHGMYGPTEATIHCTLQPDFAVDMPVNNIGIPLDTVSAFVIRPASAEHPTEVVDILPAGEEGELAVGGYQLADGYLNRDEQTKAAFVFHPEFGQLYRTGDRAKLDSQQRLMCLGRISSGQVKLRGQRIELGEIEYAASKTPGCRDVVADVISDTLVVFCVANSKDLNETQISATCRKWLPPYMVPTDILLLESMPYLASGKVDRRTLQGIHKDFRETQDSLPEIAVDDQTQKLADALTNLLGVDVLRLPTLAAAGIDSLSSIRIASKLKSAGFPQINAADILEARSLADLQSCFKSNDISQATEPAQASLLRNESTKQMLETHELLSAHLNKIQDIVACTPVQRAMLGETAKDSRAYCNWIELHVNLQESIQDVERAVRALVAHHEMLRAGFVALHDVQHPYASVIWREDHWNSAQQVDEFEYDFTIDNDAELLSPRPIQLRKSDKETHVLLQLHHSLYDQWSVDILKHDLDSLLRQEQLSERPSYTAVSSFYGKKPEKSAREAEVEFWQTHLQSAAVTPLPQLNGEKTSSCLQRSPWSSLAISSSSLKSTATELNLSAPAIFQAAFAYILGLYVGTSDVMYGTVFSGRQIPIPDVEHIVGPCLATLPVRTDVKGARSFKDLVRAIHSQNRSVLRHSETPLADVKKIGQYVPNENMFDALFVWQESTFAKPALVEEIDSADQHELSLVVEVEPREHNVAVRVTFQESRICSKQVDMFIEQLQGIVQQFIDLPEVSVASLPNALPVHLLAIDNPHPSSHPHESGLIAALEDVADRTPDAPALVFAESLEENATSFKTMSFQQMHARANRVARYLISCNVQPNDLVCVCMDKSLELYVAILAVLKTGAGYLPLLPDTPKDRLSSILQQTPIKVFLCDDFVPEDVRAVVNTEVMDFGMLDLQKYSSDSLKLPYNGSHAAYSIFTSGSTGTPKGLVVTQDNLLGNLSTLADIYPVTSGDRLLQACSQAFDVSVFEIFFAFFTGMPLCFARKDDLFFDIEHGIRTLEVTHLSLTPTVAALVNPDNVPSVRFLVTAGEAMTDVVHRMWAGRGLHQGYGPSETTNICTVNPQMPKSDIISNIGPAFTNTSAFVIRDDGPFEILPFGAVGELAFGGEQVFRGYIGRDDLNAEKIIDHQEFGRVYRSGDIGRMLPNGTILISGRLDDQVKVRGNRIELGEINASLLSLDSVKDCTTMVLGKDAASQSIATFWLPDGIAANDFEVVRPSEQSQRQIAAIYQTLEGSLPPYMIPTAMIPMTTLPRTTQGKLDKRRLEAAVLALEEDAKAMYFRSSGSGDDIDGDWTPKEMELAATLAGVMDISSTDINRNASFFALGLNSINAIAYAKAIEKRLNERVAVGTILRNASIARLGNVLAVESPQDERKTTKLSLIFSGEFVQDVHMKFASGTLKVVAVLPCTPLQEAMLSAGASQSGDAYSNRTTFKVMGNLIRLKDTWQELMRRHSILRTRFCETPDPDHPFAQAILEGVELPWTHIGGDTTVNGYGHNGEKVQIDSHHPFHLVAESTKDGEWLTLLMHHAIYDGTSVSVLLEEAEALYRQEQIPDAPGFDPFLEEVENQAAPAAMDFWSSYIHGFNAKPFPLRSEADGSNAQERFDMPLRTPMKDIDDFSKRYGVNSASLFQATWARVLRIAQGADDLCFGDVVSGRSVPVADVDRLVAPCFNTVPIRAAVKDSQTSIDLVRSLHRQRLDIDPYQLAPLRRIQAQSNTPEVHLFDSLMLVQAPSRNLDEKIWSMHEDEGLMDLPLVLELVQGQELAQLVIHYENRYLSQDTASLIAEAFASALEDSIRYPSSSPIDFPFSNAKSLENLLATTLKPSEDVSVPQGIAAAETWNEAEKLVRQALSQFSKVEEAKIQKHTSIYRLGLDSLNAVQVASRLRSKGLVVTAADVLEHRTPAAIASAAANANIEDDSKIDLAKYDSDHRTALLEPFKISASAVEVLRPCTAAQNGMLAQSLQSQGSLYVNHISYEIPENVSTEQVRSAWRHVQRKHQALRMGFAQTEEAHCPFAIIIYGNAVVQVPLEASRRSDAETSHEIVQTIHRPAWRLSIDEDEAHRTMTLSMHHALYDAESLQLLLSDFNLALQDEEIGTASSIDAVLQPMLAGASGARSQAEQFWRDHLGNATASPFPSLNPVMSTKTDLYSLHSVSTLSYESLEALCKLRGCTIQAAGQSAWALLLSAYVGEAGVTFGTVFSGRTGSPHDSVVFPSLTTLPVFCNTTKANSDILVDMTSFNGAAQRYKFVPLSDIQRFAGLSGQSLFDTVFVYQKSAISTSSNLSWKLLKQSAAVDYNVSLELETASTGDVSLGLTVNRGMIPEEHARLLLQQYDHLLVQVLSGDTSAASETPHLYSATPAQFSSLPSPAQLLHEFVEQGAEKTPDRPALEFAWDLESSPKSRKVWSYKQLNERANQVAHLIQANGARPGGIVAVCMHKCPEATFAFIGILKAGCAFLALDPELPSARREFILQDSGAAVLFVDHEPQSQGNKSSTAIVQLSAGVLDAFPVSPLQVGPIDPQSTCYCLYTSGTTGTPKGCELTHENAVQAMMAFQKLFAGRWNQNSRWLQFASYWFDVSVLEQFWSWSVGITLVGAPRDLVLDDLTLFIQQLGITHIDLTPSLARILEPEDVPSLWDGVFITGGEALKQEIIEKWGKHRTICNGYGPTEATIGVTMNPFIGPDAKAANIGPAFLNVGSYVFAPGTTTPVLRGAVGELCVSGKLVGKGYLNRPELTAKAFPSLDSGEKIYRTGDLVRQTADGSFLFIGRQDSQAKLRGQRLEIDEIDSVIKTSSDKISDVASLVIKSPRGDKETLVTFFITAVRKQTRDVILETSEGARDASHAALQSCREHLPGYMVPTHILPLNIIPLTVNNKIDGKRLTAFYNELSVSTLQTIKGMSTSTQPLGENEKKLCSVLERMLSVDVSQVDRNTNVFSMGLSSVSAIAFAKTLKRTGFSEASVALIMRNPTIGQLTDALSGNSSTSARMEEQSSIRQAQMTMAAFDQRYRAAASVRLGLQTEDIETVAPCTPLQQGLILESLRGDKQTYFNEFSFVVDNLDVALLRKAFQKISDMAQPLRTKFMQTDDGHAQVILRHLQVPWYEHQSTEHQPATATSGHRLQWISRNQQEFASPFELSLTVSPSSRQLTVHLHHALYDGISFDMIMDQVSRVYHGEDVNCGPRFTDVLPYGPLQVLKGADSFWQSQLSSNASYMLPELASGAQEVDPTESYDFENDVNLDHLCRKLGVSHQSVTQACFAVALHQVAPTVHTYGLVVSGRSIAYDGADKTLGPLFNTIPAPLQLQPGDSWATLVQRCHDFNVGALPFQHTPLRDIKKWCKRAPSDALFEVLFVFQNVNAVDPSQTSSIWNPLEDKATAEYPLAVEFEIDAENKLHATLVAKRDAADGQALKKILRSIDGALKSMAQDPQRLIADHFDISATREVPAVNQSPGAVESMPHMNGTDSFSWTSDAKKLQNEIAQLASLDANEVDERSTFFSLGLDSIDAVKLTSRLKKIGLPISVSKLLRAQTIPNILSSLERSTETNGIHTVTPILKRLEKELSGTVQLPETIDKTMIDRILPATPSQEALIAEMRRSDFREYYNHDVLQLTSGLDLEKLQRALEFVVSRSPILRTCFLEVSSPEIEAVYAQVVLKPQPFKARQLVLNDVSELDGVLEDLRNEARVSPSALPTKLSFVRANSKTYLVLSLAHAQYDGHSLALLHQDVQQAYHELGGEGRPSADGIIEASLAAVSDEAFSFWRSTLSGTQISRFPETGKRSEVSHRAESVSSMTAKRARSFCQRVGVSLQSLAQTSWAITLAHYTRRLEAVFGAVLACRDSEESEQIMFPMMNTVAIRAALHGSRQEMLKYMQNVNTDVMAYQRTPLRFIQSAAKNVVLFEANDQAKGLFDTLFIYQHRPESTGDEKEPLYESVGGDSSVEYLVAVEMEAVDESLIFRATCKDSVLDFEGTQELLERLNDVLVAIITAPEEPTVEFKGAQASICGLPFAQYKAENLDAVQVMDNVPHDKEELETSTEATVIRDALSKVSKTPPEELFASSTIESIGIDSISAIKVVALLRKQGVKLSVGELVRARTLSGMAKAAQIGKPASVPNGESAKQIVSDFVVQHELAKVPSMHSIDRSNVQMVLPALAGQIYMLNVWQKTRGQLFFPTFTYSFDSDASEKQLQAAWKTLVQGNDILRTVFCATDDFKVPIAQVILKDVPDSITFGNDCQSRSADQPMAGLHAIKSGTAWTLKLRIHHALYDAVSLPLLIDDLQTLLAGSAPTPLPITQADFLALALIPSAQSSQKAFWSSYLCDVKQVAMQQPHSSASQARVEMFKPGFLAATNTLESTARTCDVTLQSLLFASYARAYATLAKHTQSNTTENGDVVLGIYLSGRSHTEHLLALRSPTLNLVPLLVREATTTPLLESAKRIQTDLQSIGNAENSAVGLWDIAAWTGVRVDTFVNFLRLPGAGDNVSSDTEGQKNRIQPVDTDRLAPRSHIVNSSDSSTSFEVPKELESSIAVSSAETNNVYQHSIDLEATITSSGSLDVGFFCTADMTGLDGGERVLGDLKAELESLGS